MRIKVTDEKGREYMLYSQDDEKSYKERQDEWINENNLKKGDKVKLVREWSSDECPYSMWGLRKMVGEELTFNSCDGESIIMINDNGLAWSAPYFVLEPVKPTYRPCKTFDEQLQFVGTVAKHKKKEHAFVIQNTSGYDWINLFNNCTTLDGKPVGVEY